MITRAFACAVCGRIVRGKRAHAVTCSASCRVWLCRHPDVRARLVDAATAAQMPPTELLERKALAREHPDLCTKVETGEMETVKARKLAWMRTRLCRRTVNTEVNAEAQAAERDHAGADEPSEGHLEGALA